MNEFTRKAMELAEAWISAKQRYDAGDGHWTVPLAARSSLLAHLEGGGQKWLPIETAPKDNEPVILGFQDFSAEGFWMGDAERNHWRETGWFFSDDDVLTGHPTNPTHWMPLPATPTEEASK